MTQLGQRLGLDLPDPFTGEIEPASDLFERQRLVARQSEAQAQDIPLALVEALERRTESGGLERLRRYVLRRPRAVIGQQVGQLRVALESDQRGQRNEVRFDSQRVLDLVDREAALGCELGGRRLPSERLEQVGGGAREHRQRLTEMRRYADRAALVGDGARDA